MPANVNPLFALTPNVTGVAATAANTSSEGGGTVGTDMFKAHTAGANGSWLSRLRFHPVASVAATATTATVARIFVSSVGSGATTNANTFCIGEISLPASTADHSTTPVNTQDFPLGFALPAGWFIHITNHAAPAATTRWQCTCYAGDY